MTDIADVRITIKVKHMYAILFTVVAITATAVYGWIDLKATASQGVIQAKEAKINSSILEIRVSRIECLIDQMNEYQIYKIKPTQRCP